MCWWVGEVDEWVDGECFGGPVRRHVAELLDVCRKKLLVSFFRFVVAAITVHV